jgi:hypothetical protein
VRGKGLSTGTTFTPGSGLSIEWNNKHIVAGFFGPGFELSVSQLRISSPLLLHCYDQCCTALTCGVKGPLWGRHTNTLQLTWIALGTNSAVIQLHIAGSLLPMAVWSVSTDVELIKLIYTSQRVQCCSSTLPHSGESSWVAVSDTCSHEQPTVAGPPVWSFVSPSPRNILCGRLWYWRRWIFRFCTYTTFNISNTKAVNFVSCKCRVILYFTNNYCSEVVRSSKICYHTSRDVPHVSNFRSEVSCFTFHFSSFCVLFCTHFVDIWVQFVSCRGKVWNITAILVGSMNIISVN